MRNPRIKYSGPGIVPLGTSASKMTNTSIPSNSAIATPRITNHTAGRNGHLPLRLTIEPPIAVIIGEAKANATIPPISQRSGETRRPSKRRTPNANTGTVTATSITTNGTVSAVIWRETFRAGGAATTLRAQTG